MTRKSSEELVIGAARGEPMQIDERDRLAAALAASPTLEADRRAQEALSTDLAALRAALPGPSDHPRHEERLLEAFRTARRGRRRRRRFLIPAAAAGAAVIALAGVALWRAAMTHSASGRQAGEASAAVRADGIAGARPAEESAAAAADPALGASTVFYALPFAPSVSPAGSYSVVRVQIAVSTAAPGYDSDVGARVEADLLIGDDGMARAIGFDRDAVRFISTDSRQ